MTRPSRLVLVALVTLGAIAGCDGEREEDERLRWLVEEARLSEAEELWRARGLERYEFDYDVSCFCDPALTTPVRLRVVNGEVVAGTYLVVGDPPLQETISPGDPVRADLLGAFPTMEGLFDHVRLAIDGRYVELEVEYDPVDGHVVLLDATPCYCPDAGSVERVARLVALL